MNIKQCIRADIAQYSDLPPVLTNIINGYLPPKTEFMKYIGINGKIDMVDKYGKFHIEITEPESRKLLLQNDINIIRSLRMESFDGKARSPIYKHVHNKVRLKASIPSQVLSSSKRRLVDSLAKYVGRTIPLILRYGTYENTKFGTGYYLYICADNSHELYHNYKDNEPKLPRYHRERLIDGLSLQHINNKIENLDIHAFNE